MMALDVVEMSGGRITMLAKQPRMSVPSEHGGGHLLQRSDCLSQSINSIQEPESRRLQCFQVVRLFSKIVSGPPSKEVHTPLASDMKQGLNSADQVRGAESYQGKPPSLYPGVLPIPTLYIRENLGKLFILRRLVVTQYALTCIPPEISCLTNLEELNLSFNRITSIPPEIGSLAGLKLLNLSSNKITSPLPLDLERLASLEILILGHNQLMDVAPVDLSRLPSLTYLDLQFNGLRREVAVPAWLTCNLDGNELLANDSFGLDLLERSTQEDSWSNIALRGDAELDTGNEMTDPHKLSELEVPRLGEARGCSPLRKRDRSETEVVQAETTNEQKLKKSDAAEMHVLSFIDAKVADDVEGLDRVPEQECDTPIVDAQGEDAANERELKMSDASEQLEVCEESTNSDECDLVSLGDTAPAQEAGVTSPIESASQGGPLETEHLPRTNGPGPLSWKQKGSRGRSSLGTKRSDEQIAGPESSQKLGAPEGNRSDSDDEGDIREEDLALGRKHGRDRDRNPKPSKRRRAISESSPVSEKYHRESLCGAEDRLHDGFYDPGRERPFLSLEEFERETPSVHMREVILVDRAKDEELDVIASSARTLLQNLQTSAPTTEHSARALALFVSDCFGGSDRSDDILSFRRTTLGIAPAGSRSPANGTMTSAHRSLTSPGPSLAAQAAATLPSVRALCEEAIRFVKLRRGSNVVPIGALPVGICRHRAILFKYLCDRARPPIPCELVRGYLDYEPHAWNVVLVTGHGREKRLLVDCCRPGRIQNEGEGDAWFRYLPLKRIDVRELQADGERLDERLDERFEERRDERLEERLDERLEERLDERLEERLDERLEGRLDERLEERLDERVGEPLDERLDERLGEPIDELIDERLRRGLSEPGRGLGNGFTDEVVLHEEIGRGASGAVVRRCTIGAFRVAAKVVSSEASSGGLVARATAQVPGACAPQGLSELRMLYSLGPHPCIVRCLGHQIRTAAEGSRPLELLLFLEHVQSGSLEALLRRRSDQGLEAPLPPLLALQIAQKLAQGLSAVHAHGVIHRDVKSGNVLVEVVPGGEPRVKLCDFSSAVLEGTSSVGLGGSLAVGGTPPADVCVGTPRWMAPDVLRAMYGRHPYGREADIWSFGCVILEMLTLAPAYSGLSEAQVHSYIQIGRRPDLPSDLQQLRPKAGHINLDDLLESLPGEDDEAFCVRMLVGLFSACTNADAALRPSAPHVAAFLDKAGTRLSGDGGVQRGAAGEGAEAGSVGGNEDEEVFRIEGSTLVSLSDRSLEVQRKVPEERGVADDRLRDESTDDVALVAT